MMARNLLICACLLAPGITGAEQLEFPCLKAGSEVFSNVTIIGANATDLYFKHDKGISNVKLKYLDPALQKQFNYNPHEAEQAEQRQAKADSNYQSAIVTSIAAKEADFQAATNHPASSPDSVADPIGDRSLLGKQGPKITIDKWFGDKPDFKDKAILIFFWASWSYPSQKYIPLMNELQTKLGDRLQVAGILDRKPQDTATALGAAQFPNGIDPNSKLAASAGASSLPYVLLMNPKGVVLYAGHPAALSEKALQALLPKAE
jgi:thiol-disulfide isomerase/thioredoxin